MFLPRRNICIAVLKDATKRFGQLDTCCQPVIKFKSHHATVASRSPIILSGYKNEANKANKCSNDSVRSARYLWPYSTRNIYTSNAELGVTAHTISSRLAADRLIRDMTEAERGHLQHALNDLKLELQLEGMHLDDKPTMRQLWLIAFNNSMPFVGFGFLDNAIMIAAGEYIDCTVGAALGISTMAAAAIGNMISDVCGIGLAGYVEVLCSRLGIEEAHLTAHQLLMKSTRVACYAGRAAGIIIGCLIGMFPLLFMTKSRECEHDDKESH